jgi:hypothetical protein
MARKPFKVIVNWGARDASAKYRARGKDLAAVLEFLEGREEWGEFDGNISYEWKGDAKGRATSVTLTPSFTLTMPIWREYANQPQKCKDEWDAMWVARGRVGRPSGVPGQVR